MTQKGLPSRLRYGRITDLRRPEFDSLVLERAVKGQIMRRVSGRNHVTTQSEAPAPRVARDANALTFFKNYFVAGDYVTGGVGLRGQGVVNSGVATMVGGSNQLYATGTIHMGDVPQNADLLAAFLYWETAESSSAPSAAGGVFRGAAIVGTQVAPAGVSSCAGPSAPNLRVYRADVLRFLPVPTDPTGKPIHQRLVNDADLTSGNFGLTTVSLPDTGSSSGDAKILLEGVSLVVVYRYPGAPLKAIVFYDGGFTLDTTHPMTQTIQ